MALDDDILLLRKIATFRVLGPDALRVLAISSEKVHLRAGDVLFEEGEPADSAYIVIAGAVRMRRAIDKTLDEPTVVEEGALIGESALIVETHRPASAIAIQPCTLFKISRGVFMRMLESDVEAARSLRDMITRRLNAALDDLDTVLPRFEQKA
ncbi:MAG: cyclic nucleotide-binding domain-containing protein [Rhizobiales bacterium]|nr:cyclic nucleotide-binding domain-containing protein [Hyphomicrobiales bacterium]